MARPFPSQRRYLETSLDGLVNTRRIAVLERNVSREYDSTFANRSSHEPTARPASTFVTSMPAPSSVNGVDQKPIEGVSMLYTFDHPDAVGEAKTRGSQRPLPLQTQ
jgi:hypothetical protein